MGSTSDWEVMSAAVDMLAALDIPYEKRVVSAHRTPQLMYEYAATARERGIDVIIAGAGGAAHLPGMVAAMTSLPVIGVPVKSRALNGLDSLLSIVQMPAGVPVATVAINGAKNAALIAASILSLQDKALSERLDAFRRKADSRRTRSPIAVAMTKDDRYNRRRTAGHDDSPGGSANGRRLHLSRPLRGCPRGLGMQAPYSRGIRRYGRTRRAVPRERCRNIRI